MRYPSVKGFMARRDKSQGIGFMLTPEKYVLTTGGKEQASKTLFEDSNEMSGEELELEMIDLFEHALSQLYDGALRPDLLLEEISKELSKLKRK